jgi:hypothetical protein
MLLIGDIAGDTPVTLEYAIVIKNRPTADADPADLTVLTPIGEFKVPLYNGFC